MARSSVCRRRRRTAARRRRGALRRQRTLRANRRAPPRRQPPRARRSRHAPCPAARCRSILSAPIGDQSVGVADGGPVMASVTRVDLQPIVERHLAAWQSRDIAALLCFHAPDGVIESPMYGTRRGLTDIGESYRAFFKSFPDVTFS